MSAGFWGALKAVSRSRGHEPYNKHLGFNYRRDNLLTSERTGSGSDPIFGALSKRICEGEEGLAEAAEGPISRDPVFSMQERAL
jgi:hypothetical protein